MPGRTWNDKNTAELQQHNAMGLAPFEIAPIMGMTRSAISHRLAKLRLHSSNTWPTRVPRPRLKNSPWTEEKDDVLRRGFAAGMTCRSIGEAIGMSRNAVIGRACRLGLAAVKVVPTEEERLAKIAAAEVRRLKHKREQHARRAARKSGAIIPPQPRRRRIADVFVSKDITFADMNFVVCCAYPTNKEGLPVTYCGHDRGVDVLGRTSSFCQGHHNLCYQPTARQREAA